MGRVHLGDLKTSMQTDGLRQKVRDAFGPESVPFGGPERIQAHGIIKASLYHV